MNRFFSEEQCVGSIQLESGAAEVFAAIDAEYHADQHQVVVERKAFLSPDDMQHIGEHLQPDWLPRGGCVKAGCGETEASDVASDIFHSWVRHVRESIPR